MTGKRMISATDTALDLRVLRSPRDWMLVGALGFGIALLALGAHDLAITYLGVPYPYDADVPEWARYLGYIVRVATMAYIYHLGRWRLDRLSTAKAIFVFGAIVLLSFETVRNLVVDNVMSDGWIEGRWVQIALTRLPNVLSAFFSGVIAVLIARGLRHQTMGKVLTAVLAGAAINYFVLLPMFKVSAGLIQATLGTVEVPEVHKPPYGFYIYKYIYSTFIEPTFASFVLAYLLWPSLKGSMIKRTAIFAALLLLMRGRVVQTFCYSLWSEERLPLAIAAGGQFFVETLIMATLTAAVWARVSTPASTSNPVEVCD
jgi:hypothetical protein